LPAESIRFFQIDPFWIACLFDGATSLGRVLPSSAELRVPDITKALQPYNLAAETITGFLLRSEVVSGWLDMMVDAYDVAAPTEASTPWTLLRLDRLAPGVLVVLFSGNAALVEIHQKPEALHFGFDRDETGDGYRKYTRDVNGNQSPTAFPLNSDLWDENTRVVHVVPLADKLAAPTSAEFALQMIVGVEKVQFRPSG